MKPSHYLSDLYDIIAAYDFKKMDAISIVKDLTKHYGNILRQVFLEYKLDTLITLLDNRESNDQIKVYEVLHLLYWHYASSDGKLTIPVMFPIIRPFAQDDETGEPVKVKLINGIASKLEDYLFKNYALPNFGGASGLVHIQAFPKIFKAEMLNHPSPKVLSINNQNSYTKSLAARSEFSSVPQVCLGEPQFIPGKIVLEDNKKNYKKVLEFYNKLNFIQSPRFIPLTNIALPFDSFASKDGVVNPGFKIGEPLFGGEYMAFLYWRFLYNAIDDTVRAYKGFCEKYNVLDTKAVQCYFAKVAQGPARTGQDNLVTFPFSESFVVFMAFPIDHSYCQSKPIPYFQVVQKHVDEDRVFNLLKEHIPGLERLESNVGYFDEDHTFIATKNKIAFKHRPFLAPESVN